ncbi:MAG: hypothetical protein IJU76_02735 [Desulfovibrionaceae bacterium]|nr:hypothetical protein [Desulfovibrionaceae bacterium]
MAHRLTFFQEKSFEEIKKVWGIESAADEKRFLQRAAMEALTGILLLLTGLLAFIFLTPSLPFAYLLGISQLSVAAAGLVCTVMALWRAHCVRKRTYRPLFRIGRRY